jgi:hypothetical protein
MIHKTIKHIHRFRIEFLLFFCVAFLFLLGLSPVNVLEFIGGKTGLAVGMTTGVAENPTNKLALELKQKEDTLNARETELNQLQKNLSAPNKRQDIYIILMSIGIWALFVLISINFYLDYKKRRQMEAEIGKTIKVGRENLGIGKLEIKN